MAVVVSAGAAVTDELLVEPPLIPLEPVVVVVAVEPVVPLLVELLLVVCA